MARGYLYCALALCVVLLGCKPGPEAGPVQIWADPALKAALDELAPQFRRHHPSGWEVEYKESAALAKLSAEDHPDVVLAVEPVAQKLLGNGLMDEGTKRTFAGDLLTVVTPRSKPLALAKIGDLVITLFKGIGVGADGTSEGFYSKQALISDGAQAKIKDQIKEFGSIDELISAVENGSLDFGMVYASTAAQHKDLAVATVVTEDLYVDIQYAAVATQESSQRHGVVELLRLLAEDGETQQLLGSFGYLDRKTAMEETK